MDTATVPNVIDSFTGRFRFLSNFFEVPIRDPLLIPEKPDLIVPSSEHSYQARKGKFASDRWFILRKWDEETESYVWRKPRETKHAWKKVALRENWDEIKIDQMVEVIRLKFSRDSGLAALLLGTGHAQLIEGNWWKDKFWGVHSDGVGLNHLGRILMHRRDELRSGEEQPYSPQQASA